MDEVVHKLQQHWSLLLTMYSTPIIHMRFKHTLIKPRIFVSPVQSRPWFFRSNSNKLFWDLKIERIQKDIRVLQFLLHWKTEIWCKCKYCNVWVILTWRLTFIGEVEVTETLVQVEGIKKCSSFVFFCLGHWCLCCTAIEEGISDTDTPGGKRENIDS